MTIIGRPRPPTPPYDRAPFFVWHALDENFKTGEEIGPVSVSGMESDVAAGDELVFSRAPHEEMPQWFHDWVQVQKTGQAEHLLLVRDRARQRWIAMRAFIMSARVMSDHFTVMVQGVKVLEEAPLWVD